MGAFCVSGFPPRATLVLHRRAKQTPLPKRHFGRKAARLLHQTHFDKKGGMPSFAAVSINGSYAQKVSFAKSGSIPIADLRARRGEFGLEPILPDAAVFPKGSHC
jgi:hypothetical protein